MTSPLFHRLPRQLAHNAGRYIGIFVLIAASIAFVSGFLVAASSIERIISEMPDEYSVQSGQFTTAFEAPDEAIDAVEKLGVTVEEEFSREATLALDDGTEDATARLFEKRHATDIASYAEGHAPSNADEVSLDRVFCSHHGLSVGDKVRIDGKTFTISGICTLPDYSSLFEGTGDFVFNALTFCVGELDKIAFNDLDAPLTFTYAYRENSPDLTPAQQNDLLQDIGEALSENEATPISMMTAESNNAISYAADDVEGDQVMWETMLVLLIIIMAFVFVVLTNSNIEQESAIIGTLLASGYRKRELVAHYISLPVLIGIIAAIAGNLIGYLVLYAPMRDIYYNSYSLPPYEAYWNWRVFFICTILPVALLVIINLLGLMRKLRCTPLEFLRHEITRRSRRRGLALPERLPFTARFRMRVFLCNFPSFITLFCGITFASLILMFGLCMMPVVDNYAQNLKSDMVSQHQYILKAPVEIDVTPKQQEAQEAVDRLATTSPEDLEKLDPAELMDLYTKASEVDPDAETIWNTKSNSASAISDAEKFAVTSLEVDRPGDMGTEEVSVFGVQEGSIYWKDLDVHKEGAVIGNGIASKMGLSVGENVELEDPISDKTYTFKIDGLYGSASNMNVYLPLSEFNEAFDNASDYFNGYLSNQELAIDDLYLMSDLTPSEMDKIVEQLSDSMGTVTNMLVLLAAIVYVVLMYLLTKTVIDRSARSISYMKVFGYRPREVNKLYIRSITITVIASLLLCLPIIIAFLTWLVHFVFMEYNGNFEVIIPPLQLIIEICVGIVCYAIVATTHVARIRRVPLALALKIQE